MRAKIKFNITYTLNIYSFRLWSLETGKLYTRVATKTFTITSDWRWIPMDYFSVCLNLFQKYMINEEISSSLTLNQLKF